MLKKTFRNRATSIIHDFIKNNKITKKFLIPANICPVIPLLFQKNRIQIEFIDIELQEFNMNKDTVADKIKKSSGMLWVNSYGQNLNNSNFFKFCKSINKNFLIIDDKCLSIPVTQKKNIYSDLELYSTGYSKYCDLNYGGYSFSKKKIDLHVTKYNLNDEVKVNKLIKKCIKKKINYNYKIYNWLKNNSDLDEKKYLKEINIFKKKIKTHKNKLNKIYDQNINNDVKIGSKFNNWRYNICINKNKILLKKIFDNNLFASSHYFPASNIFSKKKFENANYLENHIINLFNDFKFNEDMAIKISDIINKHYQIYGIPKK